MNNEDIKSAIDRVLVENTELKAEVEKWRTIAEAFANTIVVDEHGRITSFALRRVYDAVSLWRDAVSK